MEDAGKKSVAKIDEVNKHLGEKAGDLLRDKFNITDPDDVHIDG